MTYHFDGTTWTLLEEAPVRAGTDIAKIAGESTDSVYVAGWADDGARPPIPSVAHWNGTEWQEVTGDLSALYVHAITPGRLRQTVGHRQRPNRTCVCGPGVLALRRNRLDQAGRCGGPRRRDEVAVLHLLRPGPGGRRRLTTPIDRYGDIAVHGLIERSTPSPAS
ncbi:hypothetical protein [Streptomyces pseudogriseolus]|uniref:hypothetical protein n=1 Tax=Streptomyces pseudogriseolus TaxID=36817 RepID=UPI003FA1CC69